MPINRYKLIPTLEPCIGSKPMKSNKLFLKEACLFAHSMHVMALAPPPPPPISAVGVIYHF